MLTNYRDVVFTINRKQISIAGMARPNFSGSVAESMEQLKAKHCDIVIGLAPQAQYIPAAQTVGIQYIEKPVVDFQPPEIALCEEVWDIISENTDKKIVVHCGEGFGRTGTVLAAVKLKELLLNTPIEELQAKSKEKTELLHVGSYGGNKDVPCTPMVKQAVDAIREVSSTSEHSVEMSNQIEMLCNYEQYLVDLLILKAGADQAPAAQAPAAQAPAAQAPAAQVPAAQALSEKNATIHNAKIAITQELTNYINKKTQKTKLQGSGSLIKTIIFRSDEVEKLALAKEIDAYIQALHNPNPETIANVIVKIKDSIEKNKKLTGPKLLHGESELDGILNRLLILYEEQKETPRPPKP